LEELVEGEVVGLGSPTGPYPIPEEDIEPLTDVQQVFFDDKVGE